ncbi:MAG TPA: thioredoxin family protein [Actinomycetota bacterium]|nr:thioredoxin family protein [Actinomycetota bacterium]
MANRLLGCALAAIALLAGACGGGGDGEPASEGDAASSFATPFADNEVYPLFVSSEISVGPNRFLVGLLDDKDAPVGSPRTEMSIDFFELDSSATEPVSHEDMRWVWIDKPYVGIYAGDVRFPDEGRWGAEVTVSGGGIDETVRSSFEVRARPTTPAVGERVPASRTPTATTRRGIERISTDDDPTPRFYERSIADALRAGEPFVAVFATPEFCASATCGPMLDVVERVASGHPQVTFVHVEPYELPADPPDFVPVPAVREWGLPSEPWTFVVDGRGRLAAKFEGAVSASELRAALDQLP